MKYLSIILVLVVLVLGITFALSKQRTSSDLNPAKNNEVSAPVSETKVNLSGAPSLYGLRLGMTQAEAEKVLNTPFELQSIKRKPFENKPGATEQEKNTEVEVGAKNFTYSIPEINKSETLPNPQEIEVFFYKDYLYRIHLKLDVSNARPKNVKEFIEKASQLYDLSGIKWQNGGDGETDLYDDGNFSLEAYAPSVFDYAVLRLADSKKETEIKDAFKAAVKAKSN